jgi:hypothetical protein
MTRRARQRAQRVEKKTVARRISARIFQNFFSARNRVSCASRGASARRERCLIAMEHFFLLREKCLFSRMVLHFAARHRSMEHRASRRALARRHLRAFVPLRQTLRFSRRKRKKMLADFQEMLTMTA